LKLLAKARSEFGMAVITEVMTPADVAMVCEYADILQIGTRNMQNYMLLDEVGRVRKPVMLKRGMSATIEEWLLAAEYILSQGNRDLGSPIEFRSSLEVSRRIVSPVRLLVSFSHLSNGGLTHHNPGVETLMLGLEVAPSG